MLMRMHAGFNRSPLWRSWAGFGDPEFNTLLAMIQNEKVAMGGGGGSGGG
jgi:hypothetical protein